MKKKKKTMPLVSQEPFNWIGFELFLVRWLKQSYLHMIISRFLEFKVDLAKPPLIWGARESNFVKVMQCGKNKEQRPLSSCPGKALLPSFSPPISQRQGGWGRFQFSLEWIVKMFPFRLETCSPPSGLARQTSLLERHMASTWKMSYYK